MKKVLGVGAVLLVVAGSLGAAWTHHAGRHQRACEAAHAARKFPEAAEACTRAFEHSGEGQWAAASAMAYLGIGKLDEAWRLANLPVAFDQLRSRRVRGVISKSRGDLAGANAELQRVLDEALQRGEAEEAARAAHALAGLRWEEGRYSASWELLEISEREAQKAGNAAALALAILARGDVLRQLGDGRRAEVYFRRAIHASEQWPTDRAYALQKLGNAYIDRGLYGQARAQYEEVLALAEGLSNRWLLDAARTGLARVAIGEKRAVDAEELLQQVSPVHAEIPLRRAHAAMLRRDFEKALSLMNEAERLNPDPEIRWEIAHARGQSLDALGQKEHAIDSWYRAVSEIEALIAREPQHQAWVVARHREVHDALFSKLLELRRGEDAWHLVVRVSLSEALAVKVDAESDVSRLLADAELLKEKWSTLRLADGAALEAGQSGHLDVLVLHEARGALWVGTRRGGSARWTRPSGLEDSDAVVRSFLANPADTAAARALGEAIWRAGGLEDAKAPLYVAATGRLRGLSIAALRTGGRFWFERRPLARLASMSAPEAARAYSKATLIGGDPRGDLPSAREEVTWLGSRLQSRPLLGEEVTTRAVLSVRGAGLLHLATHATVGLAGSSLLLADGELSSRRILEERPSARVVVLASCASASGRHEAGADSLTTAFLRAGSGAVVSTLRSVPDDAAQTLVRAFYEEGGAEEPIGAMTRAQSRVAPTLDVSIWSAFVVTVAPSPSER